MSNFQRLLRDYQGKELEDWGSEASPEFKSFALKIKHELKKFADKVNMELVSFSTGHYEFSGFFKREGKFVYFSYGIDRGNPNDFYRSDFMRGALYRTAESERDYRGGHNNFCALFDLESKVLKLMEGR